METKNKAKTKRALRNTGIVLLVLALLAALSIPFWNKTSPSPASAQTDGETKILDEEELEEMTPEEISENTIINSETGEMVYVPESDPEMQPQYEEEEQVIRESRTGQETAMPTSDPGN